MKPLALNLKNAKKVSTDQHSSTFQLGSGHQIKVLHAPLPALQRKQVMEMPVHKFDVGGEVPAEQSPEQEVEPISEPASDDNSVEPIANRSPAGDQTSQIQAPQPAAAQQVAPQATLGIDPTQAYNQGLGAIQTQGQLNAETAQGQAQVNAQYIEDQKKFQQGAQSTLDAISDQSQKTLEDMKNQHINPNHYVENMSAPQKVATAIGLVLGGFGSAFTGQGNPAKQFLDQQIDRDIQGQQMRMDQSKTLLGANQAIYRDKLLGLQQTQVNLRDIYSHEMEQKALENGSPQAIANAQALSAKYKMDNMLTMQSMALRKQALSMAASGQGSPAMLVPYLVPEAHQKDALKEIGQASAASNNHDFLMQKFDEATKENTLMRTGAGFVRTPQSIAALNALELPMIHDQEGRVNEYEQKTLQGLHPQPGDLDSKIAQKRQAYEQFINNKRQTPTLDAMAPQISAMIKPKAANPWAQKEGEIGVQKSTGRKFKVINGQPVYQ